MHQKYKYLSIVLVAAGKKLEVDEFQYGDLWEAVYHPSFRRALDWFKQVRTKDASEGRDEDRIVER